MGAILEWCRRLWGTFCKRPTDAAMEEELALHLEMAADDWQRRGLTREEAIRQARLQAGGVAQAMEQRRDQRGLPWLADLLQDARFGARMLRRAPLVTAVALVTLTLAISANSGIFSLVDPLLFRDLPVREPASLVEFTFQFPRDPPLNMFSLASYERYRDGNHVFSDVFGLARLTMQSRTGGEPIGAEVKSATRRRLPSMSLLQCPEERPSSRCGRTSARPPSPQTRGASSPRCSAPIRCDA